MSIIFLFFFTIPSITWILLKTIPSGSPYLFEFFYSILFIIFLLLFIFIKREERTTGLWNNLNIFNLEIESKDPGNQINDLFYDKYKKIIILVMLISIGCILIYFYNVRWNVEEHGEIDAIILWNQKGSIIGTDFLRGVDIEFNRSVWRHQSYPLGIPLTLAFETIINSAWSLKLSYSLVLFQIFLFFSTSFILLNYTKNLLDMVFLSIFTFLILTGFNYIMIQSDLCADFPLSLGIYFYVFLYLGKTNYSKSFFMGICLAWIASIKNEGLLFLPFGFLLFIFSLIHDRDKIRNFAIFFISLLLLILPHILQRLSIKEVVSQDFVIDKNSYKNLIQIDSYLTILKYFYEYHIKQLAGIPFLISFFVFLYRFKEKEFFIIILFWMITIIYNLIFIFTSMKLTDHLDQAYYRIQSHLILILYLAFSSSYIHTNKRFYELFQIPTSLKK